MVDIEATNAAVRRDHAAMIAGHIGGSAIRRKERMAFTPPPGVA